MTKYRLLAMTCLATFALALSACETMEGFGQDVQHGGAAIEDAAE
jgi:predicted small secreted protein